MTKDSEIRCKLVLSHIVKENLRKSHAALVDRLAMQAQSATASGSNNNMSTHQIESRILDAIPNSHATVQKLDLPIHTLHTWLQWL
jgi:hypothetical protein